MPLRFVRLMRGTLGGRIARGLLKEAKIQPSGYLCEHNI